MPFTIVPTCNTDKETPPEPSSGCARQDAVAAMLHHLETTYTWETEWDCRSEDTYIPGGEMLSYRRIQPSSDIGYVTLIFCEDMAQSYCYITAGEKSCSVFEKAKYDMVVAALEEGSKRFAALLEDWENDPEY